MGDHGHIIVNEHYIKTVVGELITLKGQIDALKSGDGTASSQTLASLLAYAGTDNFGPGKDLRTRIQTVGTALGTKLDGFYTFMDELVNGLNEYLDASDHVESLNTVTAEDILEYITFKPGGAQ
jgi:hypothetical protein